MAKTRRTFTREFKAEAVKLVTEQGRSFVEAARGLDIGESTLRSWRQAIVADGGQAFPGKGNPPAHEEELRRLRAENKRLLMERDVLPLNASNARRRISADLSPVVAPTQARC